MGNIFQAVSAFAKTVYDAIERLTLEAGPFVVGASAVVLALFGVIPWWVFLIVMVPVLQEAREMLASRRIKQHYERIYEEFEEEGADNDGD